jgi:hypothetical protein
VAGGGPLRAAAAAPAAAAVSTATRGAVGNPAAPDAAAPLGTPGQIFDATWQAIVDRDPAAVPREAYFAAIAFPAAVLVWLVLRGTGEHGRSAQPRRRSAAHQRIDWTGLDGDAEASAPPPTRKVAA